MKLMQKTPEERRAYFQGYKAGLEAAMQKMISLAEESAGGEGALTNSATGKRYGETFYLSASTIQRMIPNEIVETFEMR